MAIWKNNLFFKKSLEERIEIQKRKRKKYYEKQWKKSVEPNLIRIGCSLITIQKYKQDYFNDFNRDWLIDWCKYRNVCLPPTSDRMGNPFPKKKRKVAK
ncbi:hypothetical protein [Liquorilactobacillus ghanensis]|uniref:hypothetical protein n=1 Tax=Liquorilactobacillus ghanensis TaxID=399370 RepID=UPI0039EB96EB